MAVTTISLGKNAVIGIGAAGQTAPAGTFVTLGGKVSGSLSISSVEVDTTNADDGEFTSFLLGSTTVTLSAELRLDRTDAGQEDVELVASDLGDGTDPGSTFKDLQAFAVYPEGNDVTGKPMYAFDGYITSWDVSIGHDDAVNVSIEAKSTGPSTGASAPSYGSITVP